MEIREAKARLRRELRARRRGIDPATRAAWDAALASELLGSAAWREAGVLLAYRSMPEEAGTGALLEAALKQGKRLLLPRCAPGRPGFDAVEVQRLEPKAFETGPFGILQPPAAAPAWPADAPLDLILAPGLGFTPGGLRLGQGGGMYDRFLAARPGVPCLGLCYALQVLEELPTDSLDRPVDGLVTEKGWLRRF